MKTKFEKSCEEHMGEMALWRTVMNAVSLLLTLLVVLKVYEVV
jgi:hypothetical protein